MKLNLRFRIFLTLVPLLVLILVVGIAGTALLYRLGDSIGSILRENYRSVIYMERLNEAVERIDSSFQFALAGQEAKGKAQYAPNWQGLEASLQQERMNVTLPGEDQLVKQLTDLVERYRRQGDDFYKKTAQRSDLYFGPDGLLASFTRIKQVSGKILGINQQNMKQTSKHARKLADSSLAWFAAGVLVAVCLSLLFAWSTIRTILWPIQAVTQSALGISAGKLDQLVPVLSSDEMGQLADSFNSMARKLRELRHSNSARLLRAQRTSQATIDSFPDPLLMVDSEGCVELANPAARRLLGVLPRTSELAASVPWQPPEALRLPLLQALREQRNYLPEDFDHAILLQAGSLEHSFLPRVLNISDPDGQTLGAAVLLEDVTRFRLLDQFKTDLVATVSHELKTPLTSLRLGLHLLLEESLGPLSSKQMELLLDARDNAERLLAIVNNLLDLARLEEKQEHLTIRPESVAELLRSAAARIQPRADDKQVAVEVVAPANLPPAAIDVQQLAHALNNLLDNAVTYTDPGGRITLSALAADGGITLCVADTGRGIPPEHLSHVFDRFFRVPGQDQPGGTGLGLAIVHEIVTAHGGRASCESRPGSGTVFRLSVPVFDENRTVQVASDQAQRGAHGGS